MVLIFPLMVNRRASGAPSAILAALRETQGEPTPLLHRLGSRGRLGLNSSRIAICEHGVADVLAGVLGLEPDFVGLDVARPHGVALAPRRLDAGVPDILFAVGKLDSAEKAHSVAGWMARIVEGTLSLLAAQSMVLAIQVRASRSPARRHEARVEGFGALRVPVF